MEYRYQYLSNTEEPFYFIERKRNKKWRFCYKVDSVQQAQYLIQNPIEIEKTLKLYKIFGLFLILSIAIIALVITFKI